MSETNYDNTSEEELLRKEKGLEIHARDGSITPHMARALLEIRDALRQIRHAKRSRFWS